MVSSRENLRILLVEDNRADAVLFSRALKRADARVEVTVCSSGEEARAIAHRAAFPFDIVVTDINLPGISGIDFLNDLNSSAFSDVPTLVLSSSQAVGDISAAYRNRSCGYVLKPNYIGGYDQIVEQLNTWWLHATALTSEAMKASLALSISRLHLSRPLPDGSYF